MVGIFFFHSPTSTWFSALWLLCRNGISFSSLAETEYMRLWVIFVCFFLLSCGSEPKEVSVTTQTKEITTAPSTQIIAADTDNSFAKDTTTDIVPVVRPTKKPSGIYRFLSPYEGSQKILHTIAFYPGTYRLQEEYPGKKDSIVVTEGTWAPSEGVIWLYKDQIVRGRYTWKGDTLQYYSPRLKKNFSMAKLSPVTANKIWQTKKGGGTLLYGVGNEPFWSVEVNNQDSIVLNMPDWNTPLRVKMTATDIARDSTVYAAPNDSLHITVYPFFCNDGMSDFLYTRKVKMTYKGQTYKGCGEVLRSAR
jgi:uncharacterized membrane protein